LKLGQSVALRFAITADEKPRGHVDRLGAQGAFRVTFEGTRDKYKKVSGGRFWYPASSAAYFTVTT
jgi:hypothetical protein